MPKFFSTSRTSRISDADRLLAQLGSDDWLTDVLLATSEERLATMTPTLGDDALTSFSSRHVNIQASGIDSKTGLLVEVTETDAVTVAPPENTIPQPNGRALTTVLEVYPSGTPFDPDTPIGIPP